MLRLSAAERDEGRLAKLEEAFEEESSGFRANELCPTAGDCLFAVFPCEEPADFFWAAEAELVDSRAFLVAKAACGFDGTDALAESVSKASCDKADGAFSSESSDSKNAPIASSSMSSSPSLKCFIGTTNRCLSAS